MNDDNRICPDCGGDGFHYDDCIYDGTDGSSRRSFGSGNDHGGAGGKTWLLIIIILIIGYGFNELLGAILLIGLLFWNAVTR